MAINIILLLLILPQKNSKLIFKPVELILQLFFGVVNNIAFQFIPALINQNNKNA